MIRLNESDRARVMPALMGDVREWYMVTFPSDPLGDEIPCELSFWDVVGILNIGFDIYEFIPGDSIVRERIFGRIAAILGIDYDVVYATWLGRDSAPRG